MKNLKPIKAFTILQTVVLIIVLLLSVFLEYSVLMELTIWSITSIVIFLLYGPFSLDSKKRKDEEENININKLSNEALNFAKFGIVRYDDNYKITWMSSYLREKGYEQTSDKITAWLPEIMELLDGSVDNVKVCISQDTYIVSRKSKEPVLLFKDITKEAIIQKQYIDDRLVLGLVHFDNYDEIMLYEDESNKAVIYNKIRKPVIDYISEIGGIIKNTGSTNYLIVLNETSYNNMASKDFPILKTVRDNSKKLDLALTLSMAFARGSNDANELDTLCSELLALAQSRGGDQIVTKLIGQDIKFYGGRTETNKRVSKVRVRVMANSLLDLLKKSSNVIIVGHKDMDADCVAATIITSNIARTYNKESYIIAKTGGIEPIIGDIIKLFEDDLNEKHNFVSESEALNQLNEDTLVIMVDHHNVDISNGKKVLNKAKNIVILDHHRRLVDLKINPTLLYIEPQTSSATELLTELIPYMSNDIDINVGEANLMYLGLIIDTNHFVNRTSSRTFDAASVLRSMGADPMLCDQLLEEDYDFFTARTEMLSYAVMYDNKLVCAIDNDKIYSRTMLSMVANTLVKIKEVDAAYVIGYTDNKTVAISARGNEELNVHVVMEKMGGGGHLTQAAMQREKTTIKEVELELLSIINDNESN